MNHDDNISKQIRQAAENAEQAPFPGMDKVWLRVEDKLDHKKLSSQKKYWKKLAVAASVLLVGSVGYQFLKENPQTVPAQHNTLTAVDTTIIRHIPEIQAEKAVAIAPTHANPATKENAAEILKSQVSTKADTVLGMQPAPSVAMEEAKEENINLGYLSRPQQDKKAKDIAVQSKSARGVTGSENEYQNGYMTAKLQANKKADPLIVLNGSAVTGNSDKEYRRNSERAMEKLRAEADSIVVLPDPLYIINGKEYHEKELFGRNPTSPYYPLNRQEILSISILKDEDAAPYGEKGKKGVVIIITRDGKPVSPEKTKR